MTRKLYRHSDNGRRSVDVARWLLSILLLVTNTAFSTTADNAGSSDETFINGYLGDTAGSTSQLLWLDKPLKEAAEAILGHRFNGLRVRYWGENQRTVWILDEIGKELPITMGIVVEDGAIADIRILEYREVRGGEVRYPFFTDQFKGLTLEAGSPPALSGHIDGITGATLSVAAVRKVAILALLFHQHTPFGTR